MSQARPLAHLAEGWRMKRLKRAVKELMRLPYSEQALVSGGGELVLVSALQQPCQVPSGAHGEPLRDPRQWHRRLRTQLPD